MQIKTNLNLWSILNYHRTGVIRLLRRLIGLKEEAYQKYAVRCALWNPIIELAKRAEKRYNLLASSLLELFEFIKQVYCALLTFFLFLIFKNHF